MNINACIDFLKSADLTHADHAVLEMLENHVQKMQEEIKDLRFHINARDKIIREL